MNRTEFLQQLKSELEGRVPYSMIQENLRYYDSYISEETAKGLSEAEVIDSLGGPRIIARTIVDAAMDAEDRPDGYDSFGTGSADDGGTSGGRSGASQDNPYEDPSDQKVHYVDFSKWYVRLIAGLVVFLVIFLVMNVFFGIMGLAGLVLSYTWPFLLVLLIFHMFHGPRR